MGTWSTLQARIYWGFTGALLGLGIITLFSLGIALVLLGAILLIYPASKKMIRTDSLLLWIALAAMGLAPAAVLTLGYVTADPSTDVYFSGYWFGVLLFAAIGLAGIIGGATTIRHRSLQGPR